MALADSIREWMRRGAGALPRSFGFMTAIFALVGASAVFVFIAIQTIERDVSLLHLEIARRAEAVITDSMVEHVLGLTRAARDVARSPENSREVLNLFLRDFSEFTRISLLAADGKEEARLDRLALTSPAELTTYADTELFKKTSAGGYYTGPIFFSETGTPLISLAIPVISLRGDFLGAVTADLNLRFLWDLMAQIRVGERGRAYVVDDRGNLIADPDPSLVLRGENVLSRSIVNRIVRGAREVDGLSTGDRYANFNGITVFAAGRLIPSLGWGVIVEEPLSDAFSAVYRTLIVGAALTAFAVILLIIISIGMRRLERSNQVLDVERHHTLSIISNLTDGLIEYSPALGILLLNPEAERLLGVRTEDIGGRTIQELAAENTDVRFKSLAAIFSGELAGHNDFLERSDASHQTEVSIYTPQEHIVRVLTIPVVGSGGGIASNMKIVHDVTREKLIERLKTEFITIAAHQLRTPLSAVKWTLRMAIDGDLGPMNAEQKDFLNKGYSTNERMIHLVNDLLDVSRIEEGKFGYQFKEGDLIRFLDELLQELEVRFREKKMTLAFRKPDSLPPLLFDPEKLGIAFTNLISNAVNYTPSGGSVTVTVARVDPYVEVRVADTGAGIPSDQIPRLFTKFFRGDNVVRMQTEGTGLGLFIVKNIIIAHGGDIRVESEEGKGTSMIFTLP